MKFAERVISKTRYSKLPLGKVTHHFYGEEEEGEEDKRVGEFTFSLNRYFSYEKYLINYTFKKLSLIIFFLPPKSIHLIYF